MFFLVLLMASGLKMSFTLPDSVNDSQKCIETGLNIAHYINDNVPNDAKVIHVTCLRNA